MFAGQTGESHLDAAVVDNVAVPVVAQQRHGRFDAPNRVVALEAEPGLVPPRLVGRLGRPEPRPVQHTDLAHKAVVEAVEAAQQRGDAQDEHSMETPLLHR